MKYVLAPLAGFTDAPFRRLCFEGGADLTYTEMVSAAGLAHGSSPTCHLFETMPGEGPVALQLFGAKESDVAYATDFIQTHIASQTSQTFVELNLNAGCPMKKVTREGAGAKLIESPDLVHRLLKAMVGNTSLPVTLKTRLGPHPQKTNVFELLDAAEQAGAKGLIVHARYTSQMHGGSVDLDALADVVARARIPVTGNGSVVDAKTAAEMAKTGVDAIMIGRAALANPGIFSWLKCQEVERRGGGGQREAENFLCPPPSLLSTSSGFEAFRRHLRYLLAFRDQLAARFPNDRIPSPDAFASVKMHVHLFRYFNGRPGAAELRRRLNAVRTLAEVESIVRQFEN